jgi:hypothetical protein
VIARIFGGLLLSAAIIAAAVYVVLMPYLGGGF